MCRKIEETYYEMLQELGTGEIEHYGRSLFQHLKGTYELLHQSGNSDEICVAGLFHSVYGTEPLNSSKFIPLNRSELEKVIGKYSENWCFYFVWPTGHCC